MVLLSLRVRLALSEVGGAEDKLIVGGRKQHEIFREADVLVQIYQLWIFGLCVLYNRLVVLWRK